MTNYLDRLLSAVEEFAEFRILLPARGRPACRNILARFLSSWIDPQAIARVSQSLHAHPDEVNSPATFDLGTPESAGIVGHEQESVIVAVLEEATQDIHWPTEALDILVALDPDSYHRDALGRLREQIRRPHICHLPIEARSSAELFVRVETTQVGRELLRQPLFALCRYFTRPIRRYVMTRVGVPSEGQAYYDAHDAGFLEAYLGARLADARGVLCIAGCSPGRSDTVSLNLQFTREFVLVCDPPMSAEFAERARTVARGEAAEYFKTE